jgi:hypothetical protein
MGKVVVEFFSAAILESVGRSRRVERVFVSGIRVEQVGLNGSAYRRNFNQLSQ